MDRERLIASGRLTTDRYDPDALITAGGWCSPIHDDGIIARIDLPRVTVARGGIDFTDRRTDAEKAAETAMQAHLHRLVVRIREREHAVIERACLVALINDWDLHIYRAPYRWSVGSDSMDALRSAYIGIGYSEAKHGIPTLHEHDDHDVSELDDDDDEWFPPR